MAFKLQMQMLFYDYMFKILRHFLKCVQKSKKSSRMALAKLDPRFIGLLLKKMGEMEQQ